MLRSPLFVPGNKANMLEKALTVAPDALVHDMEDSARAAFEGSASRPPAATSSESARSSKTWSMVCWPTNSRVSLRDAGHGAACRSALR